MLDVTPWVSGEQRVAYRQMRTEHVSTARCIPKMSIVCLKESCSPVSTVVRPQARASGGQSPWSGISSSSGDRRWEARISRTNSASSFTSITVSQKETTASHAFAPPPPSPKSWSAPGLGARGHRRRSPPGGYCSDPPKRGTPVPCAWLYGA